MNKKLIIPDSALLLPTIERVFYLFYKNFHFQAINKCLKTWLALSPLLVEQLVVNKIHFYYLVKKPIKDR